MELTERLLTSITLKRQRFAVVFLFGLLPINQNCYAIDSITTTEVNYRVERKVPGNDVTNVELKIKKVRPAVSIIIDDLGDRLADGLRAVSLPAPYTYSFLPNTPFARKLATAAKNMNKEVMLHIPMQATTDKKLGPNGLTIDMSRSLFDKTLLDALASIPFVRGINNHMGSLLSTNKQYMGWAMSLVARQSNPLYFIDSRTTASSVISESAKENNVNTFSRDTFLDYTVTVKSITEQIHYLIRQAKKKGSALGIAHPYPETMDVLEIAWPLFYEAGVDLLPVSELIKLNKQRELSKWQLSSFH